MASNYHKTKKIENRGIAVRLNGILKPHAGCGMLHAKKGVVWLSLLFTPIGLALAIIALLLVFGLLGFGVFLTLNLLTVAGLILVIVGLISAIKGNVNVPTLVMVILGFILLIIPHIGDFFSNLTLAAVLG